MYRVYGKHCRICIECLGGLFLQLPAKRLVLACAAVHAMHYGRITSFGSIDHLRNTKVEPFKHNLIEDGCWITIMMKMG